MLTNISLSNFKCFESLQLPLKPLTLLCGLNGTGKSSVIQSLLLLSQSSNSVFNSEHGAQSLNLIGSLTDMGTGKDVLYEDAEQESIEFKLQNETLGDFCINFFVDLNNDRLRINNEIPSLISNKWLEFPPFDDNIVYISAERSGPRKTYPLSHTTAFEENLGPQGEFTLNYLHAHRKRVFSKSDPRCYSVSNRNLLEIVEHWLQEVSPGCHLNITEIKQADLLIPGYSFDKPRDVPSNAYRSTHVGFGLSYVLPVVVAFLSQSGSLCLVENPEAHLHPRGQTMLAELAAQAAEAGVQLIIETHSDHFLDGVRIAVRNGLLNPENTVVHYFERESGRASVTTPEIDTEGRLSMWPAGFFDQQELNLIKLLGPVE